MRSTRRRALTYRTDSFWFKLQSELQKSACRFNKVQFMVVSLAHDNFCRFRTWSWPSGWCIGLRSWLRWFDAQLGHLHDACTSLPEKS